MDPQTHNMPDPGKQFEGKLLLGIDVGGTNIKLGLVDAQGGIQAKGSTATPPLKTPHNVFAYAMEFASEQLSVLAARPQIWPASDWPFQVCSIPASLFSVRS